MSIKQLYTQINLILEKISSIPAATNNPDERELLRFYYEKLNTLLEMLEEQHS